VEPVVVIEPINIDGGTIHHNAPVFREETVDGMSDAPALDMKPVDAMSVSSVDVHVKEARGLHALYMGGTLDPYAVIELADAATGNPLRGQKKKKTQTMKKTLDPVFVDGEVTWSYVSDNIKGVSLRVSVFNASIFSSEVLGVALVPLAVFRGQEAENAWYKLESTGNMDAGEVLVSMRVVQPTPLPPPPLPPPTAAPGWFPLITAKAGAGGVVEATNAGAGGVAQAASSLAGASSGLVHNAGGKLARSPGRCLPALFFPRAGNGAFHDELEDAAQRPSALKVPVSTFCRSKFGFLVGWWDRLLTPHVCCYLLLGAETKRRCSHAKREPVRCRPFDHG